MLGYLTLEHINGLLDCKSEQQPYVNSDSQWRQWNAFNPPL